MSDKRLIKKVRSTAIYDSVRGLSIQYAEVLRLRQAVREAETQLATQRLAGNTSPWPYTRPGYWDLSKLCYEVNWRASVAYPEGGRIAVRQAIFAIRPAPPSRAFRLMMYGVRRGKGAVRSVAEYLAKAASSTNWLVRPANQLWKNATLTWLRAIAFWRTSGDGSSQRVPLNPTSRSGTTSPASHHLRRPYFFCHSRQCVGRIAIGLPVVAFVQPLWASFTALE